MESHGSLTTNQDKSKDLNMGLSSGPASANVFVSGYKDGPAGNSFAAAGANLGVQTPSAGASVQATHIPSFGNQLTASGNVNLLNHNDHKVDAHAFHTTNMPKVGPNFTTHGGGVDYSFKETIGIGASTVHTPIARMNQHSVTGNLNLHRTPNSSLDFNVGAHQTTTPFSRGQWQPGGQLTFRKQF